MSATEDRVTDLLVACRKGDRGAYDALLPLVYDELRRLARGYLLGERANHTLQATALVNEAYMRLIDLQRIEWRDRAHFIGIAAASMRRILVDHARKHQAGKRRGRKLQLRESIVVQPEPEPQLAELDEALDRLASLDPRQGRIVELRFFGGMTVEETARALDVSPTTVKREWRSAKAWLYREIRGDPEAPSA